ncbi:MAG: DNA polymerase III subunit epsilon [Caulobacteraceae bacterium]|nr:DNA polymerase III subunit epsilon [Caulobacter sp.]
MAREIVLDTETTGLDPRTGHRVIELACIEVDDLLPTGSHLHLYIHPDRAIDPEAEKVHGISLASLEGKPRFADPEVIDRFLEYVADCRLVAHNAAFDRGFINMELERAGRAAIPESRWRCTYQLAQSRFPGMYNSLDALCKRYKISLAEREKHGALIDTRLLALVYLELQGGKERGLEFAPARGAPGAAEEARPAYGARPRPLAPRSTPEERARHGEWLRGVLKTDALWAVALGVSP